MKRIIGGIVLMGVLAGAWNGLAAVVGEDVEYSAGDVTLKGYLAYDDEVDSPRPGVLVVPEWWGQDDFARSRAQQLAKDGYVALAVDMYGEGRVVETPQEAGELAGGIYADMTGVGQERFRAAYEFLQSQPNVNPDNIAAIGYCFGGSVVLRMARLSFPLKGVASFHGSLDAPEAATPGAVKARVLVLTGEADPMVPAAQVENFEAEMRAAQADFAVVRYPGATHSFTNPKATERGKTFGLPIAYDEAAATDSWQKTLDFLKEVFAGN